METMTVFAATDYSVSARTAVERVVLIQSTQVKNFSHKHQK